MSVEVVRGGRRVETAQDYRRRRQSGLEYTRDFARAPTSRLQMRVRHDGAPVWPTNLPQYQLIPHTLDSMASSPLDEDVGLILSSQVRVSQANSVVQVFAQLRKPVDPEVLERREKEVSQKIQSQFLKAQERQAELVRYQTCKLGTYGEQQYSDSCRSASTRPSQ